MRIFQTNLVDSASVVQTYSTQDAGFPASNLRNPQRTQLWRTDDTVADEWSVFDLGSAQAVTGCAIFTHTLLSGDSAIRLQGHTSNAWGAPSFSQTLAWSSGTIFAVFSSQSFRWWRFIFTKASAGVTRDIGRLWIGTYYAPTDVPDWEGVESRPDILDAKQRVPYGQTYGERRATQRRFDISFSAIPNAQRVQFVTIADAVGEVTPFILQIDENAGAGHEFAEPLYVILREAPRFGVAGYDTEVKWDTKLMVDESL